jgi:cobalt-zinc-cadmium efflux system outer membrane protein
MKLTIKNLLLTATLLLTLSAALAQPAAASLQDTLALAVENSAPVGNARNALEAAGRALERTQADPLALAMETLQAEHTLGNSRSALRSALLAAEAEALAAYADVLALNGELQAARLSLKMAEMTASATEIRFAAGAVTQLDLDRARNDLAAARRKLADSGSSLELARSNLASLTGSPLSGQEPEALGEPAPLPPLDEVLLQLESNSQLQQARQAVQLAELELAAVDTPLSSQARIEQARAAVQSATTDLASLERSLNITIRQNYNAVLSAEGNLENARARTATAREALAAQQLRFNAGSISQLELHQAELELLNATSQDAAALHAVTAALHSLQRSLAGGR